MAYLLEKLKSIPEGDGTLLDHCMIVYGSGISDGNAHTHDDLPILLAGKGNGTIKTGRHIRYPKETPLTNLYVSMLDRMGVKVDRLRRQHRPARSLEDEEHPPGNLRQCGPHGSRREIRVDLMAASLISVAGPEE